VEVTTEWSVHPTGVDIHAHYFGPELSEMAGSVVDPRWPVLVIDSGVSGRITLGGRTFRTVRSPLWDVERRIAELDSAGIAVQLMSPVPVMLAYWADPRAGLQYARLTNDSMAAAVERSRGRLLGLGTVPLPHVDAAIDELRRVVEDLGLAGVEIGTQIAGWDLDASELRPFFEAAESLDAALFVHPMDGGGGVVRRAGQPYDFGLGMTTDTAIAATALVFGGVLDRFPNLRVCLAHGCGSFPWVYPRLSIGAQIWDGASAGTHDKILQSLWVDSLVFDAEHLRLLVQRFGPGHVMLGTDYPFVAGQLEGASRFLDEAQVRGVIEEEVARRIYASNGLEFVALDVRESCA
jgi:aminocarboxymuconate-semialdehyde decarboxylase